MSDRFKKHGAFSWSELMTNDVAAAKKFYGELFNWKMEEMPMSHGGTYTVVKAGDEGVGGIMDMPPNVPPGMPPVWGTYVTVDNVDETAQRAQKLGGKVVMPPMDIPNVGRMVVIQDPQGAVISAITYVDMVKSGK